MAQVCHWNVYDLEWSIFRSGYPMLTDMSSDFIGILEEIKNAIKEKDGDSNPHINRAVSLARARGGGHDQFLTGVAVSFDLTFSLKAWTEMERYTFMDFVSSQSTMHRIAQMEVKDSCNKYVTSATLAEVERLQEKYCKCSDKEERKALYLDLLYNLPSGFELTAGLSTNYRCLKNIYEQRRNHRLPDWQVFCDWIESLPLAMELICGGE